MIRFENVAIVVYIDGYESCCKPIDDTSRSLVVEVKLTQ